VSGVLLYEAQADRKAIGEKRGSLLLRLTYNFAHCLQLFRLCAGGSKALLHFAADRVPDVARAVASAPC
jgi:hypothetical protein